MKIERIIELAEKAGAFPVGSGADNSFGFRERALERFARMIAAECASICEVNGESYQYSFTASKAHLAESTSMHCSRLIKREFGVE